MGELEVVLEEASGAAEDMTKYGEQQSKTETRKARSESKSGSGNAMASGAVKKQDRTGPNGPKARRKAQKAPDWNYSGGLSFKRKRGRNGSALGPL